MNVHSNMHKMPIIGSTGKKTQTKFEEEKKPIQFTLLENKFYISTNDSLIYGTISARARALTQTCTRMSAYIHIA